METLIDLFETFVTRGEKTAFVNRTGVRRFSYSYRDLHTLSLRAAGLLAEHGVEPGDRVLLWGPNSSWWGVAFWGTLLCGGIAVPVDFMSERERAETIRKLTGAKLVLQSRFKLERIVGTQSLNFEELPYLLADRSPLPVHFRPAPRDTAQLIYTSGTTGNPKGVILTHANLIANISQINRHITIVSDAFSFLSLLPLSHMFEQMGGFFTPLYRGASIVYPRTLKPSAIMEALAEEDIYAMICVPRLLQLLKNSVERELGEKKLTSAFNALRSCSPRLSPGQRRRVFFPVHRKFGRHFQLFVSGGAPLDPPTFSFWRDLGFLVLEGYGLTECSPVLTANKVEKQIAGSVGCPLPEVELQVREKEIVVRGPNVFPGYYQNDRATREAFTADGWFRTGDIGEQDHEGWLTIKGREKELIVTGAGVNVYPDELEAVLNRTPGVRESCVIGLEKAGGEEVHAVLLLDGSGQSPDQILAQANRELDSLHQIGSYSIWGEPEFPKTTTLKIRKFVVKDQISKGASPGEAAARDRLVSLLAQVTGTQATEIREESRLMADLGLSSIGRLELVNYLEQEFRLDLDESALGPETRVEDLRRVVETRPKSTAADHFRLWSNSTAVRVLRMTWDAIFHYPLFRLVARLETHGEEHLKEVDGPVLMVANHQSYLDQPCLMFSLPRRLRYRTATAAWEEFFFANYRNVLEKLWKRFTYNYGTLFLNLFPLPQSRGFSRSLRFMGRLADRDLNILIFPEGAHARQGEMQPFQPGLGVIVQELGVPVLPVLIQGSEKVLPPGHFALHPGRVTVTFGPVLRFGGEEPAQIVEAARQAVADLAASTGR